MRRFCRLQSRQPRDIPADPAELRRQLAQMCAPAAGLSQGSFRNLKTLLGKALIEAGITSVPRRSRTPLGPEWRQLLAGMSGDRHQRYSLSHLARYCSERGILRADIDDEVVAVYGRDLVSKSLLDRPKQAYRNACLARNRAADTVAGWPQRRLRVPSSRPAYTLSPATFPASFGTDLEAYFAHLRADDPFGEMGDRPASPDTLKGRRKQILALASALRAAADRRRGAGLPGRRRRSIPRPLPTDIAHPRWSSTPGYVRRPVGFGDCHCPGSQFDPESDQEAHAGRIRKAPVGAFVPRLRRDNHRD
jgi:hypothetical protein